MTSEQLKAATSYILALDEDTLNTLLGGLPANTQTAIYTFITNRVKADLATQATAYTSASTKFTSQSNLNDPLLGK